MALFSDKKLGLNQISILHQLNHPHNHTQNHTHICESEAMERKSGLSRIPKLTHSFRRTVDPNDRSSRESTPSKDDNHIIKAVPGSKPSGATVSRSKSLRLPRPQYNLKSNTTSGLESYRERTPESNAAPRGNSVAARARERIGKESGSSSSPGSSRASSPGLVMSAEHSHPLESGSSTEVSAVDSDVSKTSSDNPFLRRRAQSFGPHIRGGRGLTRPSVGRSQLKPPSMTSRGSRSNTPTFGSAPQGNASSSLAPPGQKEKSTHRQVRSRSSLGTSGTATVRPVDEDALKPPSMKRADSSGSLSGKKTLKTSSLKRDSRRPTSSYLTGGAADLNQLAHEITSSMEEEGLDGPEFKSVSRLQSTGRVPGSARHKQLTSSAKVGVVSGDHTSSTAPLYPQGKLNARTRSASMEKLQFAPRDRNKFGLQPPESGGGLSKIGRVRSATTIEESAMEQKKSQTSPRPRGSVNRRSSTPSSGRSTPVGGTRTEKKTKDARTSPTNEATTSAKPSRPINVVTRTPYRRVARVREARPVGINELEGAVLMDADEYLKISHEVKALKTALLKLKRELQGDASTSATSSPSMSTPASRTAHRTNSGGPSIADLNRKIDQLKKEKEKADDELNRRKSDMQKQAERLEKMNSDLQRVEGEKKGLQESLQQMEQHRDLLLDKVERLHADKHKLEDRLSSLEKAQFYEGSSSWLDEPDGGGVEWEETLMLDGGKGEKTESDIGEESSEPESAAVCAGPHS